MTDFTTIVRELDQFLDQNPTLAQQRRAFGKNGRWFQTKDPELIKIRNSLGIRCSLADEETVERCIGEKLFTAGSKFLDDIHKEIFSALPQKEQDAITADLESLARGDKELPPIKVDETGKPELTADYLRAIGKPEYIEWGTDRQ
jgi:hypothetical protein